MSVSRIGRVAVIAAAGLLTTVALTTVRVPVAHADDDDWRGRGGWGDRDDWRGRGGWGDRDDWRHGGWGDRDHDDWYWHHRGGGPGYVAPPVYPGPVYGPGYYYQHPYYRQPWMWHHYPSGPHIYIGP